MSTDETFEIPLEAAEAYERKFVPALFARWAPQLVALAGVSPGHAVLDVACGTGIVARAAADVVGASGTVVGVDRNEAMLEVARRVRPDLDHRRADAGDLPFDDASFDVVLCQMALMFFADRVRALAEMGRVARAGGTVAVLVPAAQADQPAYGPFVDLVAHHAGPEARSLMGAYWSCGSSTSCTGWWRHRGSRPGRRAPGPVPSASTRWTTSSTRRCRARHWASG